SDKFDIVEKVVQHYKDQGRRVIDIDGARVYFDNGWALVRASNTQPILVVRVEAKTPEALKTIKANVKKHLENYPQVNTDAIK
ncbi:MAG: phosphomannomutase, partial [candidate division WOR-3 bacterium]|nr:phosphomannomutase [candidate division WOR-3 bacterium]